MSLKGCFKSSLCGRLAQRNQSSGPLFDSVWIQGVTRLGNRSSSEFGQRFQNLVVCLETFVYKRIQGRDRSCSLSVRYAQLLLD
jgi:hypothetical protein